VTLGAMIRRRRLALGLTQQRLARRMGWDDNQVWLFESGARGGPGTAVRLLVALGRVLDLPIALLVGAAMRGQSDKAGSAGGTGKTLLRDRIRGKRAVLVKRGARGAK